MFKLGKVRASPERGENTRSPPSKNYRIKFVNISHSTATGETHPAFILQGAVPCFRLGDGATIALLPLLLLLQGVVSPCLCVCAVSLTYRIAFLLLAVSAESRFVLSTRWNSLRLSLFDFQDDKDRALTIVDYEIVHSDNFNSQKGTNTCIRWC